MDDLIQPGTPSKGLVERAKAMVMSPKTEWPVVASETDSVSTVLLKYVLPLAAIGPLAALIGGQLFGLSGFGLTYRPSLMAGLTTAISSYVLAVVGVFVLAFVANFLAPKFGGKDNFASAFRWVAYAFTASWLVGIVGLVPMLGVLGLLALYSLYVLYIGIGPMMGVPQDKSLGFFVVTIIAEIVLYVVIAAVAAQVTPMAGLSTATIASADQVQVDVPGYGEIKVSDDGDRQTVEVPGVGRMEVTKEGDTVKVEGENFKAEVKDTSETADE